jgi:S1-C subfamily serine protease
LKLHRATVILLLTVSALSLSGCLSLIAAAREVPPLPEPEYAAGIPPEEPLPDVRTAGLSAEEVRDITVYRNAVRAVVSVSAVSSYRTIFGRAREREVVGSGYIMDGTAHVVTNNHVIEGAQRVWVTTYDGSAYPGKVIGADPETDLAVIRFDPLGRELTTLTLGDSSRIQVGQKVYALGSPFGLEGTLTVGAVSGVNRPVPSESGFILRNLIQTDAAINTGNSGGPLLNTAGEVIGINVLIVSPSGGSVGVGFAIPSNSARRVVDGILADGEIERGWIQMNAVSVTPGMASSLGLQTRAGVMVTSVHPGGNAEAAGLRDGAAGPRVRYGMAEIPLEADIITAVNGTPVASIVELLSLLEPTKPGDEVQLTVRRAGERVVLTITLSERPE